MTTTEQIVAALNDEDFRDLVDRDLRRENTDQEAAALRSPALVDRWYNVLVGMTKSVDGQLAAKKQDYDAQKARYRQQFLDADAALAAARGDDTQVIQVEQKIRGLQQELASMSERFSRSRAATLRFKSGLEETMVEARAIRNTLRDRLFETVVVEERNRLASKLQSLESAILAHKLEHLEDASDADHKLWQQADI